jgi:hypothetical protein
MNRWQKQVAVAVAIALVVVVSALIARNLAYQDALLEWRSALEASAGAFSWPEWDPRWPPLPQPRRAPAQLGDLRGPYAYAGKHPEVLQHIPCYCGCAHEGHRSNLQCYVSRRNNDGQPEWTDHTFGCPMCAHITREVALMLEAGRTLSEARGAIDAHYGQHYSVATPTPRPD